MKAQTAAVLRLMRTRGADGLSSAEAREVLACDRLAARIHELRAEGHDIERVMERSPIGAVYARWFLREPRFQPVTGVQEGLFR